MQITEISPDTPLSWLEEKALPFNRNPNIGWWKDSEIITFYHGTHKDNVKEIMKKGMFAPEEGPTANWISLALEPNTAFGYASMHGGESGFRAAGAKAYHVEPKDRAVIIIKIPRDLVMVSMAPARGFMDNERDKLDNKERYLQWSKEGKTDQEYYALTEIRIPNIVDKEFIDGYMVKDL